MIHCNLRVSQFLGFDDHSPLLSRTPAPSALSSDGTMTTTMTTAPWYARASASRKATSSSASPAALASMYPASRYQAPGWSVCAGKAENTNRLADGTQQKIWRRRNRPWEQIVEKFHCLSIDWQKENVQNVEMFQKCLVHSLVPSNWIEVKASLPERLVQLGRRWHSGLVRRPKKDRMSGVSSR